MVKELRDPDAETRAKMVRFAQCMRDAGHDFPDPGPNGFDFRRFADADDGFKNSAKECHEKHPFVDLGDVQRPLNELRPVGGLDPDDEATAGARLVGPYSSLDEVHALRAWAARPGEQDFRDALAGRLADGIVEFKAAWVDRQALRLRFLLGE
ncbi:hypothetical protein [Actinocorallia aurantiaca]